MDLDQDAVAEVVLLENLLEKVVAAETLGVHEKISEKNLLADLDQAPSNKELNFRIVTN